MLDENVFLPEYYTKILKKKHSISKSPYIRKLSEAVYCKLIDLVGAYRAKKWVYNQDKGNPVKQNMELLVNHKYIVKDIIDVPLCVIQAKGSAHPMGSIEMWSTMTVNKIVHYVVDGDHETLLYNENAVQISEVLKKTIG